MYWLEPLVEVATDEGRVGYGPVKPERCRCAARCRHARRQAAQSRHRRRRRLSLAQEPDAAHLQELRHHRSAQPRRLQGAWRLSRAWRRRLPSGPKAIVEEVITSGLRGRGGAGFPTGIKWRTVAETPPQQKYIVCNADEGDSGTFADRMIMEGDPFVLIEGMTIAGIAVGATYGYIYIRSEYPACHRGDGDRRARGAQGRHAGPRRRRLRHTISTWRCGSAPAPTSAARRPRCSRASKASAARCAPSRRCRPISACSASRPSSTTCSRSPPCRSS